MKHTVLITGAAGYIGAMLVAAFSKRSDVERIIGIDKESVPDFLREEQKLTYFQMNTADAWEEKVRQYHPDIVMHTAWQIRELYGNQKLEWKWNVEGSDKVFEYALSSPEVKRLVHFSTVASYGALPENSVDHRYIEAEPFRKTDYLYAEEKRVAEEHLKKRYEASDKHVAVSIVRPAAITGPRGRFMRIRFGLQSTLAGQMKGGIYSLISALVAFVPITPKWLRQFVHEDDVVAIVEQLAFGEHSIRYEAFNLCPPGAVVRGVDMAKVVGKRVLPVFPWMVRFAFFVFWHLSRGKVPTGRGAWKGYSYPIAVDGSKITRELSYHYQYAGLDAFQYTNGTYESAVPEALRKHKRA